MPDQFTHTTTTGYGSRIVNSIKRIVFGFVLFVASFAVLYWNEGRVDMSDIAKTAVDISSTAVSTDASLSGKLISTSGVVNSDQMIGDGLFLNPDKYVAVERKVEMYAWEEESKSTTKTNVGGSETTETTYTYKKVWQERPEASSGFAHPEGHENPAKSMESSVSKVTAATIGAYNFDPQQSALPGFTQIPLTAEKLTLTEGAVLGDSQYVYIPVLKGGVLTNPQVGDLRISYHVLTPGFNGTIFGKLNADRIEAFVDADGNQLYRVFSGTREQGIATMHSEYTMWLWIFRGVGFLMMWFGLSALFGPISVVLDVLPIFGSISRSLIGGITFIIALVLSIVTILVSMILHNVIALLIALALAAVGIFVAFKGMKKKKAGGVQPAPATTPTPPAQK